MCFYDPLVSFGEGCAPILSIWMYLNYLGDKFSIQLIEAYLISSAWSDLPVGFTGGLTGLNRLNVELAPPLFVVSPDLVPIGFYTDPCHWILYGFLVVSLEN